MKALRILSIALVWANAPIASAKDNPAATKEPADAQQAQKAREEIPYGKIVIGRPGFVNSPFAAKSQLVDVKGTAPGVVVKCPYSNKLFRVPEAINEVLPAPASAATNTPADAEKPLYTQPADNEAKPAKPANNAPAKPDKKPEAPKNAKAKTPENKPADTGTKPADKPAAKEGAEKTETKKAIPVPTENAKATPVPAVLKDYAHFPFLSEGETFGLVSCTTQKEYVLRKKGKDGIIVIETVVSTGRSIGNNPLPTPTTYNADGSVGYAVIKQKFETRPSVKYGSQMPYAMELEYPEGLKNAGTTGVFLHERIVWPDMPGVSHGCVGAPKQTEDGKPVASEIYKHLREGAKVIILGDARKFVQNGGVDIEKYVTWKSVGGKNKAFFKIQLPEATREDKRAFLEEAFIPHKTKLWCSKKTPDSKSEVFIVFPGIDELHGVLSVAEFERIYADYDELGRPPIVTFPEKFVGGAGSAGNPVKKKQADAQKR